MNNILGPIMWDWLGWLARGFTTLIVSRSGEGKSGLVLRLAASYLCGDPWPDGTPFTGELGSVLWCEAEAGQAINLERAREWGLPLNRIITPFEDPLSEVNLDDPNHLAVVKALAQREDIRMVAVDSLGASTLSNDRDSEIGRPMKALAQLARDAGKCNIVTHHLRKRTAFDLGDSVDLEQVSGNVAIVKFARLVWALDRPDLGKPEVRRMSVIKSNLGRFPTPLGMTFDGSGVQFCAAPVAPKEESVVDRAAAVLRDLLSDGPKPQKEIQEAIEAAGLSWRSAQRAKDVLNIRSVKKADGWYWQLPDDSTTDIDGLE
jgi:hypothetical protein